MRSNKSSFGLFSYVKLGGISEEKCVTVLFKDAPLVLQRAVVFSNKVRNISQQWGAHLGKNYVLQLRTMKTGIYCLSTWCSASLCPFPKKSYFEKTRFSFYSTEKRANNEHHEFLSSTTLHFLFHSIHYPRPLDQSIHATATLLPQANFLSHFSVFRSSWNRSDFVSFDTKVHISKHLKECTGVTQQHKPVCE
jgi:hypothetical protein